MENVIDKAAGKTQYAIELMKALRGLESGLAHKSACVVDAITVYLEKVREIGVCEALLGVKPDESALLELPSLDGLFRFGVIKNDPNLVKACLELGANPREDEYWGLIYPLAFNYPEIISLVAPVIVEDLPALTDRWAQAVLDGVIDSPAMLGLLIQVRDQYCRGNILREGDSLCFCEIPKDLPTDQLQLFA